MRPSFRHKKFPWEHHVDEETKTVYVCIPGGYPSTLALPFIIAKFFPDYEGKLCTKNFLLSFTENDQ